MASNDELIIDHEKFPDMLEEGEMIVCLIDNGAFRAAGIAYRKEEVIEFTRPNDERHRVYYAVDIHKLLLVSNLEDYLRSFDWQPLGTS